MSENKDKKTQKLSSLEFSGSPDAQRPQPDSDSEEKESLDDIFANEGIESVTDTAVLPDDSPALRRALREHSDTPDTGNGTASLGEKREVILLVRGMAERLVMQENVVYRLGRFELGARGETDIDLTPYGAMDRGVSRMHAQLELKDNKLYITDLNSTNGTYLNASRIEPFQAMVLHKGDDVILGRLAVQVLFR
jgi:hypothetical protein